MEQIIDMAKTLNGLLTPGRPVSDLKDGILAMDAHVSDILKEQRFDPGKLPTEAIAGSNADHDLAAAKATQYLCRDNPVLYLPALYQAYEDYVYRRAAEDLTLFATDFACGRNVRFVLSTSSFGHTPSYTTTPVTNKTRVHALVDSLADRGYVIVMNGHRLALRDCEANRALLRQYCEKVLDAEVTQVLTWRDTTRHVSCIARLDKIRPVTDPEPEDVPVPETLSEDLAAVVRNILVAIRDAASSYVMADVSTWCKNAAELKLLALANVQATMHDLEAVTGIHADAFDDREARFAPIRKKNREARAIRERIKLDAGGIAADAANLYDDVYGAVENLAATMGMYPATVQFQSHGVLRMELCPDTMGVSNGKARPARMKLMRPSFDCMDSLFDDLRLELPNIRVDGYEGGYEVNGADASFKLKALNLRITDTRDLVPLLRLYGNSKD